MVLGNFERRIELAALRKAENKRAKELKKLEKSISNVIRDAVSSNTTKTVNAWYSTSNDADDGHEESSTYNAMCSTYFFISLKGSSSCRDKRCQKLHSGSTLSEFLPPQPSRLSIALPCMRYVDLMRSGSVKHSTGDPLLFLVVDGVLVFDYFDDSVFNSFVSSLTSTSAAKGESVDHGEHDKVSQPILSSSVQIINKNPTLAKLFTALLEKPHNADIHDALPKELVWSFKSEVEPDNLSLFDSFLSYVKSLKMLLPIIDSSNNNNSEKRVLNEIKLLNNFYITGSSVTGSYTISELDKKSASHSTSSSGGVLRVVLQTRAIPKKKGNSLDSFDSNSSFIYSLSSIDSSSPSAPLRNTQISALTIDDLLCGTGVDSNEYSSNSTLNLYSLLRKHYKYKTHAHPESSEKPAGVFLGVKSIFKHNNRVLGEIRCIGDAFLAVTYNSFWIGPVDDNSDFFDVSVFADVVLLKHTTPLSDNDSDRAGSDWSFVQILYHHEVNQSDILIKNRMTFRVPAAVPRWLSEGLWSASPNIDDDDEDDEDEEKINNDYDETADMQALNSIYTKVNTFSTSNDDGGIAIAYLPPPIASAIEGGSGVGGRIIIDAVRPFKSISDISDFIDELVNEKYAPPPIVFEYLDIDGLIPFTLVSGGDGVELSSYSKTTVPVSKRNYQSSPSSLKFSACGNFSFLSYTYSESSTSSFRYGIEVYGVFNGECLADVHREVSQPNLMMLEGWSSLCYAFGSDDDGEDGKGKDKVGYVLNGRAGMFQALKSDRSGETSGKGGAKDNTYGKKNSKSKDKAPDNYEDKDKAEAGDKDKKKGKAKNQKVEDKKKFMRGSH